MRAATLALLAAGCATARPATAPPPPAVVAVTQPAPPAGPVHERAQSFRQAATLLDQASLAKQRGNRSYAEQQFSSAEMIVGPAALAQLAQLFREGAPPRLQTALVDLPPSTPPQQPFAVGDSQADEPDARPKRGALHGTLQVDGKPLTDVPAVVTLEPADGRFRRRAARQAIMEQRDREFAPHLLAVPTGSTVTFPNFDSVFHNVFSRSDAAAFDLGLYRGGQARAITFEHDGIVRLGCNLHRNMSAYVVVVSQPHYIVTDKDGRFFFRSLEPGRYLLRIWSERSEPTTRELTVAAGEQTIALTARSRPLDPGTDKFGAPRDH